MGGEPGGRARCGDWPLGATSLPALPPLPVGGDQLFRTGNALCTPHDTGTASAKVSRLAGIDVTHYVLAALAWLGVVWDLPSPPKTWSASPQNCEGLPE